MTSKAISKRLSGFTLIEGLVLIFVFSVVSLAMYQTLVIGMYGIGESKRKISAVSLANEKMELIRSMRYEDIAVQGGVPSGSIDPDEMVTIGNITFHVLTDVRYVDDPDDGTEGGSPDDDIPNDYKVAKIDVKWGDESPVRTATLVSRFVPVGIETDEGGGTLSINIVDFLGDPVSSASVNIYNDTVSPTVNLTSSTDSEGNLTIPSTPAADDYRITVSKNNYEYVQTIPASQTNPYAPTADIDITVLEGDLTTVTIISGQLSHIDIQTEDPFNNPVADVNFNLEGGRYLGTDPSSDPYYNYNQSLESNSGGTEQITDISPGAYNFELAETGYTFWKIDYGSTNERDIIDLPQGVTLNADVIILDDTFDSYFPLVTDSVSGGPIENASVRVKNDTLGYDVTLSTDQYGYVFFPEDEVVILTNSETYDVEISASGYNNYSGTVVIDGLVEEGISIDPS